MRLFLILVGFFGQCQSKTLSRQSNLNDGKLRLARSDEVCLAEGNLKGFLVNGICVQCGTCEEGAMCLLENRFLWGFVLNGVCDPAATHPLGFYAKLLNLTTKL